MILKLATAYNPGDADSGKTYNYLHIDIIVYNSQTFTGTVVYDLGTCDANGVYSVGEASPRVTEVTTQAEFAGFVTAMSAPGEPAMVTSQRLAYQFLIDHRGRTGTIDLTLPNERSAPTAAVASNDVSTSSSSTATSTPTSTATSTTSTPSTSSGSSTGT